jgi:hypothetical protein
MFVLTLADDLCCVGLHSQSVITAGDRDGDQLCQFDPNG